MPMRMNDDSRRRSVLRRHETDARQRDPLAEPQHEHAEVVAGGRVVVDRAAAAHRSGVDVDGDAERAGGSTSAWTKRRLRSSGGVIVSAVAASPSRSTRKYTGPSWVLNDTRMPAATAQPVSGAVAERAGEPHHDLVHVDAQQPAAAQRQRRLERRWAGAARRVERRLGPGGVGGRRRVNLADEAELRVVAERDARSGAGSVGRRAACA